MKVLLLTRDLSVVSQVDGAAARSGAIARTTSTADDTVSQCANDNPDLILLDLNAPSLDVKSLVARVKAAMPSPPRIVAFGSHVHVEKLAAAREAGCDEVISRGQFFAQTDGLLRGD